MLLEGSDFGVDSGQGGAKVRNLADGATVPLEGTVDQGANLGVDVASSFGIGESLISNGLLQAFDILW